MSRRYRSSAVTVTVDVSEVINEIEDEDLLAELKARKLGASTSSTIDSDWLDRLRWFLQQRDVNGAMAMVEAALWPAQAIAARMTSENKGLIQ